MTRLLLPWLWLWVALPAGAVVIDRPDGSANTSAPGNDPGFAHVANVQGLSGVYLGNGWILTAAHVATGPAEIGGLLYPAVDGTRVQLQPEGAATLPPDLALWRLAKPWPELPALAIRKAPLAGGEAVVMIGNGADRTGTTTWIPPTPPPIPIPGYTWGGSHHVRWGTNAVDGFPEDLFPDPFVYVPLTNTQTHAFYSRFDCTCTASGGDEAMVANGDSGGAVFIETGGEWRLAGILFAASLFQDQPYDRVLQGNLAWAADLRVYRDQILAWTAPPIPALPGWGSAGLAGALAAAAGLARPGRPAGPGGRVRKRPAPVGDPR